MYSRTHAFLEKVFPVPRTVSMPSAGVDISDHSIKIMSLTRRGTHLGIDKYGSRSLPEGVIKNGVIKNREKLIETLQSLKETFKLNFVRASLPEEGGYLFTAKVPCVPPDEIRGLLQFRLEENIPISPNEAIFDYQTVPYEKVRGEDHEHTVIVSAFSRATITEYQDLFREAGLVPVSLEIEAQAVSHAVIKKGERGVVMIVDFGKTRSGITVADGGAVRFTTTVDVGGDSITKAIREVLPKATDEEVQNIKNTRGIVRSDGNEKIAESLMTTVSALRDEMNRHALYWHNHDGESTDKHITKIIMCGGSSNLAGLISYLGATLKIPVVRANVWENVFSLEKEVPPIPASESLGYAQAIGLALDRPHE